jgi:hypothetical protein
MGMDGLELVGSGYGSFMGYREVGNELSGSLK